jgi:Cu/Ag efflux pump CusA
MSLSGTAIAIGAMIDAAIIVIEYARRSCFEVWRNPDATVRAGYGRLTVSRTRRCRQ